MAATNRIKDKSLLESASKSDVLEASKAIMGRVKSLIKDQIGESEIGMAMKMSSLIQDHLQKALYEHFHKVEKDFTNKVESLQKAYEAGIKTLETMLKNLPTTILPKEAIQVTVQPTKSVKSIKYDPTSGRPVSIEEEIK